LFKWRHFEPPIIVCAVRWYLRYSLSYRDVEELVTERGLPVDHTTIWRWVQRYAPELNKRCRRELKPTNGSWRVDETYISVAGIWTYLYRAVDSSGATIDFWLSAQRDAAAAKVFFQRALRVPGHPRPRVIKCRRQSVLSEGDHGIEAGAQVRLPLSLPYLSLLEQHRGARPSGDPTAGEREPRIPIL
jgi:IS6 family transposase